MGRSESRFVPVALLGVFMILGSLSVSGSLAQLAPVSPTAQTHEFAFTRFLGRYGQAVAIDKAGYVYVTGRTPEVEDLVTAQRAQKSYGGGQNDAFVAKYTSDGQRLIYATYLGGGEVDMGEDIAVDEAGNAYVAGITYSKNFPTTSQSVQRRFGGGDRDCFVAKVSADGSTLLYSTLLGGEKQDRCSAIALDERGNAHVTGSTNSLKFAASNTVNSRIPGKDWDVFTAKLDAEGRHLEYVLRFGGTAGREPGGGQYGGEFGTGIAVDGAGTAYVVGQTDSADFPIRGGTPPALQGGGSVFIVRISATGSERLSGTYLVNASSASAVALDTVGNVYVTGNFSSDPRSAKALQQGFVMKLTPTLDRIVYSSAVMPAPININGPSASTSDIAVDGLGRAYVVGTAQRPEAFPRLNPLQKAFAGNQDAFLVMLDAGGAVLLSSTVGGGVIDYGEGVAVDGSGAVYVAGTTLGGDYSIFPGGKTLGERRYGAFISKIVPRTTRAAPVQAIPTEMEFVKIQSGEFEMGCPGGRGPCGTSNDSHRVRITKGFEIGKHEVTQAQWMAVMGSNNSRFRGPDLPVEQIRWDSVQEFIRRLNARQDGYRYRLPTEAEWEYAARAGTSGKYAGTLDEIAWYWDNAELETHPVGQRKPNAWGLFDMYGNVRELVQDWHGAFPKKLQIDPDGPASGTLRIVRGGSWADDAFRLQAWFRETYDPVSGNSTGRESSVGFRCIREPAG